MNSEVVVNVSGFLNEFTEFENTTLNINTYLNRATRYISKYNSYNLNCENRQLAIYLMTAHFLILQDKLNNGNVGSMATTSASIDKVSVGLLPPPNKTQFDYWLNQTQYGAELLALLENSHPTPMLIGGSFIRVFK